MSESLISKQEKRVIFPTGKQCQFLLRAIKNSKLPWPFFANKIRVCERTLNDWRRGKYSLPLGVLKRICTFAKLKIPQNIEIREPFWSTKIAGQIAGKLVYQKYGIIGGDPKIRKQKWLEWWDRTGKFNPNKYFIAKEVVTPKKDTELAEFVGIIIGDGGITKRQVTVTLNYKTDKHYSIFVGNLIKKLFKTEISIFYRRKYSTVNIIVSRTRLVVFCKSIGLQIGNKLKQNLDIPKWIKKNKNFEISCVRGLVDTDGCIFNECHKIKGEKYCYPRLAFTSYSKQLCASVFKIFEKLGFMPKIRNNRNVQLENRKDIIRYFQLIGTNNLHHKKRFKSFLEG